MCHTGGVPTVYHLTARWGASCAAVMFFIAGPVHAIGEEQQPSSSAWELLRAKYYGDRPMGVVDEAYMSLEVPGNTPDPAATPLTLRFADDDHRRIKRVRVFIDNNPSPLVATMDFADTPVTEINMRVRIDRFTSVRAVAETTDGGLEMRSSWVKERRLFRSAKRVGRRRAGRNPRAPSGRCKIRAGRDPASQRLGLSDRSANRRSHSGSLHCAHPGKCRQQCAARCGNRHFPERESGAANRFRRFLAAAHRGRRGRFGNAGTLHRVQWEPLSRTSPSGCLPARWHSPRTSGTASICANLVLRSSCIWEGNWRSMCRDTTILTK